MAVRKKTVKKAEKVVDRTEYIAGLEGSVKALQAARVEALELLKRPGPRFVMNGKERGSIGEAIKVLEGAV